MKVIPFLILSLFWIPALAIGNSSAETISPTSENPIRVEHPWSGKKVAFLGDSITDPNNYADTIRKYWSFMEDQLAISPYVYGVSGRQWNDVPRQAAQLESEHGNEFDAIVIFMGTNDYNAGVPIGTWYSETEEKVMAATGEPKQLQPRTKRTLILSNDTLKGRINIALLDLKKKFPEKQIVLLTPLHRAYAKFSDNNIQPDQSYQNSCGEYIDAYIDAIKEAGNIWAVPVIDWSATAGLNPMVESQLIYFNNRDYDRLHPNTLGHQRLAQTLIYQLLALPASF